MRTLLGVLLLAATPAIAQDWVAGVEGNDAASNTWITHYNRHRLTRTTQLVYWQSINYLTYRVVEGGSTTHINSPGVSAGVMYRREERTLSAGIGGGYDVRRTE